MSADHPARIGILGSSQSGKTVYLLSLWWQLNGAAAKPRLQLRSTDGETRSYIRAGLEGLLEKRRFPGHTNAPTDLSLVVARPGGRPVPLVTRDYRGEDFDRAFAENANTDAARELTQFVRSCSACLVFLAPWDVTYRGGSTTLRTVAVLEGLEQALGARRAEAGKDGLVRPHVAVVLTMIDTLRSQGDMRQPAAVEGFLRARGLGPSLDAISRVSASVAFFGVSAVGRVEGTVAAPLPPADLKPEGVDEPMLWALDQVQSTLARRRRNTWALGISAALLLSGAATTAVSGAERAAFRAIVTEIDESDADALFAGADRADAYARAWGPLARAEAHERARDWRGRADAILWKRAEIEARSALASTSSETRVRATETLAGYLTKGTAHTTEAADLSDALRLAPLEAAVAGCTDALLDQGLAAVRQVKPLLLTSPGRRRAREIESALEARAERRDLAACRAELAARMPRDETDSAVSAIDRFLVQHPASAAASELTSKRGELVLAGERRKFEAIEASVRTESDLDKRCGIVREYLRHNGGSSFSARARALLRALEEAADDHAFQQAQRLDSHEWVEVQRYVAALGTYLGARPNGRHFEETSRLREQGLAFAGLLAAVGAPEPRNPEAIAEALRIARGWSPSAFDAEIAALGRRWTCCAVRLHLRSAQVRASHTEWFSDPDPQVVVWVQGLQVLKSRVVNNSYTASYDEETEFVYSPGGEIVIELRDDDVFGYKLVDRGKLRHLLALNGSVALGESRVGFDVVSVKPGGL